MDPTNKSLGDGEIDDEYNFDSLYSPIQDKEEDIKYPIDLKNRYLSTYDKEEIYQDFDLLLKTDQISFVNIITDNNPKPFIRPSLIQNIRQVIKLTKVISNKHKTNNQLLELLNFDKNEYDEALQYYNNINDINDEYLYTSYISSLEDIKNTEPLIINKSPDKKKIKKNKKVKTDIEVIITDENIWEEIEYLQYKDAWTSPRLLYDQKISKMNFWHIISSDSFRKKHDTLYEILLYIISKSKLDESGVIYHIIFMGKTLYNYIIENPNFVLFILNQSMHHNIPKYLSD